MVDTSAAGDKEEAGDVTESEDAMMEETQNEGKDDRSETQSSTNQETKTIPNAKNKETKKRKCSGEGGAPERGDLPEVGVGNAPDHSSSTCRWLDERGF